MSQINVVAVGDSFITQHLPYDEKFMALQDYFLQYDVRFTNFEVLLHDFEVYPAPVSGGTWAAARPEVLEDIKKLGIALSFVPEDRLGMGLVGSMDLTDNMMIRSYKEGKHFFADRKAPKKLAQEIVDKLEVVTPGVETPVSRLSGGNVQKILVGREIASNPNVLMVAYPVRGLDINSSYTIYNLLNDQKKKGVAVICVGEDLDVLLELCDRILVLNGGRVSGIVDARSTTKEKLGLLMTGSGEEKQANE